MNAFLGALDTKTDVTIFVTDSDDSLEAGTLTGTGLLLDWLDLEDFVLKDSLRRHSQLKQQTNSEWTN